MSGDFFFFFLVVTIGERMYWHLVAVASCWVPDSPTAKGYPPVYADPIVSYLHYVHTENIGKRIHKVVRAACFRRAGSRDPVGR